MRISAQFAVSLMLILFLAACAQEPVTIFAVSFDKTLVPANGGPAPQSTFQPDFKGYLMRHALRLQPGNVIHYSVPNLDLESGTFQFWMKAGARLPAARVNALYLFDGKRTLEFSFDKGSFRVEQQREGQAVSAYRSQKNRISYGRWYLLTITWDDSSTHVYSDDQPVSLSAASSPNINLPPSGSAANTCVGLWGNDSPFSIVIRDLVIRNRLVNESWIQRSFEATRPQPQRLVYRMRDFVHWNGKEIRDPGAADGIAWTTDTELAKLENMSLPSTGEYELSFHIKPTTDIPGGTLRAEVVLHNSKGDSIAVSSRENEPGELTSSGLSLHEKKKSSTSYQSFNLRFHVQEPAKLDYRLLCSYPGKYSLFLDTATLSQVNGKWIDRRRVEDLQHTMGIWKEDPEASKGRAWTNQSSVNIGPYTCIGQPGKYRATWRLKISTQIPDHTRVVVLKVFAHDGFHGSDRRTNKDYGVLQLTSDDFAVRDTWITRSIDFKYDGSDMLEFIAHALILDPGALRFDTITVEPLQ
jgi:hypothetical protein